MLAHTKTIHAEHAAREPTFVDESLLQAGSLR